MNNRKTLVSLIALLVLAGTPAAQARKAKKTTATAARVEFAPSRDIKLGAGEAAPRGHRIAQDMRLFESPVIEQEIARIKAMLTNPKLAAMFEQCFPNTLDTTVHFRTDSTGQYDSFVVTGDINAGLYVERTYSASEI